MGCSVGKVSTASEESIRKRFVRLDSQSSASSTVESQQAERALSSSLESEMANILSIVHFNDVYELQERANNKEPIGGAARFKTKVDSLRGLNPLVVFSGDCLNPSRRKWGS